MQSITVRVVTRFRGNEGDDVKHTINKNQMSSIILFQERESNLLAIYIDIFHLHTVFSFFSLILI